MKFCKDCVHCRPDTSWMLEADRALEFAKCGDCGERSLVSGELTKGVFCSVARNHDHLCGEAATRFVPRPESEPLFPPARPWWRFWT